MILYLETPKGSTKEPLELVNKFNKITGYNIIIQKLIAFLYTDLFSVQWTTEKRN